LTIGSASLGCKTLVMQDRCGEPRTFDRIQAGLSALFLTHLVTANRCRLRSTIPEELATLLPRKPVALSLGQNPIRRSGLVQQITAMFDGGHRADGI
jgi:hypothetical protein